MKDEKEHPPLVTIHSQHSNCLFVLFCFVLNYYFVNMRAIDKIMKRKIFNVSSDKDAVGAVTGPRGGSQRVLSGF